MNPWQSSEIAAQMRANVDRQLAERPWPVHFRAYSDAVSSATLRSLSPSILEVGSGVGHGHEILGHALLGTWKFTGLDISEPAIAMARERYPDAQWYAADAATLPTFEKRDVVVDGSCVLHIEDWRAHLGCLCGAARDAVILHRIPIVSTTLVYVVAETRRSQTRGYGQVFDAWEFALSDVTAEMSKHGFAHTETRKADGESLTLTFRKAGR